MTVIRPNSISGINSITANGGDINLFRADGTKADVPIVNNITAGVVTATKFVGPIEGNLSNGTINATSGTITGNLGVGGVLTYEDVTNIDSIGIITARAGINVSGGTITGDGSGLTGVGLGTDGSANTSGIITATAFVPTTGQLSHRNIIVNGAMTVAQRGSSSTAQGYETVDRFKSIQSSIDEVAPQSQVDVASGTTPYTLGFRKAFKFTNGNQTSGAGSGDLIKMMHRMEAQDIANSGWNYLSSSSYLTMSFWVKSSVAQNFYVTLIAYDSSTYSYTFETGALSANTWTKVTHSIPGNSNLVFNNDNGLGLEINWYQFAGTNYTDSSHSLNTWGAYNGSNLMPDMTSTWYTTDAATFELTGVQLEVGPVATPFEHRTIGEEFRRCQRYYQQYTNIMSVGYVPDNTSKSYSHGFHFPVEMRAAPTLTITNTGSSGGQYVNDGQTNSSISSLNAHASQTSQIEYYFNITTDLSNFRGAYAVSATSTTYQTIYKISAEL